MGQERLADIIGEGKRCVEHECRRTKASDGVQFASLRAFINDKPENGLQVFRRTVSEWIKDKCNKNVCNRAVRGLLFRIGYRRRRGRRTILPLNDDRKARIRRFLVEMSAALVKEGNREAAIVCMDESFSRQLHGPTYFYFLTDEDGVVQDGTDRTSRKDLRMITVHAITKGMALAALDENNFPIPEGWFKLRIRARAGRGLGRWVRKRPQRCCGRLSLSLGITTMP